MEWLVVGIISVSALIFGWWVRGKELALQAEVRRLCRCGVSIGRARFRRVLVCELVEDNSSLLDTTPCWSCQRALDLIRALRVTLPRLLFDT